jgi:hypothetical protein
MTPLHLSLTTSPEYFKKAIQHLHPQKVTFYLALIWDSGGTALIEFIQNSSKIFNN